MKRSGVWALGVGALMLIALAGWYALASQGRQDDGKLHVVATFFPLADFARSIGTYQVSVTQITPDGVEPHDYEPSPQDVANLLSSDVVLINGGGVDAWAEELIPDAEAAGIVVVRMSDVVPFLEQDEQVDPHAWLDMARTQEMVRAIAEAFIVKDTEHLALYATNADNLRSELANLDAVFSSTLAACPKNTILVSHDAFRYWELRYNVHIESVAGLAPEAEPSVQDIAELVEHARKLGVTTVFFESPASTGIANTLANEIGASVDVLYPLEGRTPEQIAAAETYTDIMEQNLSALSRALTCTMP